jgi:uncharacterized membrane protein YkvA (DUF1232 family)
MSGEMWTIVVIATVLVVIMVVLAVVLLVKVVRARKLLRNAGIPLSNKLVYWGSILYLICPVDLLPDPVLLDDIGLLLLALRSLYKAADVAGLRSSAGVDADALPDRAAAEVR